MIAVLAGLGEADKSSSGPVVGRPSVAVLCEILYARSVATGGGVHAVSVLFASETRLGHGHSAGERQYGRPNGQLHSAGVVRRLYGRGLSGSHVPLVVPFRAQPEHVTAGEDHGQP